MAGVPLSNCMNLSYLFVVICICMNGIQCSSLPIIPKYIIHCLLSHAKGHESAVKLIIELNRDMELVLKSSNRIPAQVAETLSSFMSELEKQILLPSPELIQSALKNSIVYYIYDRNKTYDFELNAKQHDNELVNEFIIDTRRALFHLEQSLNTDKIDSDAIQFVNERFHLMRIHFQFLGMYCSLDDSLQTVLISLYEKFCQQYLQLLSRLMTLKEQNELSRLSLNHDSTTLKPVEYSVNLAISDDRFLETVKKKAKSFTHLHFTMDLYTILSQLSSRLHYYDFVSVLKSLLIGVYELDADIMRHIKQANSASNLWQMQVQTHQLVRSKLLSRLDFDPKTIIEYIDTISLWYRLYSLLKLFGVSTVSEYALKQYEYPIPKSWRFLFRTVLEEFMTSFTHLIGQPSEYKYIWSVFEIDESTEHSTLKVSMLPMNTLASFCQKHGFDSLPPALSQIKDKVLYSNLIPLMDIYNRMQFLTYYYQLEFALKHHISAFSIDLEITKSLLFYSITDMGLASFETECSVVTVLNRFNNLLQFEVADSPLHQLVADICRISYHILELLRAIAQADHYQDSTLSFDISKPAQNLVASLLHAISSCTKNQDIVESIRNQNKFIVDCKSTLRKWGIHVPTNPQYELLINRLLDLFESTSRG